nr:truncated ORF7a protein [Severe acute respiratory syndrome coronavirus 2]QTG39038.1 truncated ORF7a protein [Severe acute respiratory syndrome coronavirus 2]
MKIILFLALITLATCELYHYQECVRGTTVLLKEPCSSGTYEGNSPFHPLADNKFALTCFSTQFAFACPDGVKHVYVPDQFHLNCSSDKRKFKNFTLQFFLLLRQ